MAEIVIDAISDARDPTATKREREAARRTLAMLMRANTDLLMAGLLGDGPDERIDPSDLDRIEAILADETFQEMARRGDPRRSEPMNLAGNGDGKPEE